MKNYFAYSTSFFETSSEEVLKLGKAWIYNKKTFEKNLIKIKNKWGNDIMDFTIRELPEKRGTWDNAVLLVIKKENGCVFGKRYHNSQHIYLEYY